MENVKREYNEDVMLSAKMEAQQRINQIRMAIKMAMLKTEETNNGDQTNGDQQSEATRMADLRRKLTEEEMEAKRQINRIRMAILRARRTEEQIVAERISQRARMAALRRKRSEQEMQTMREAKRAQMAAFRKRRTEEQAEADRRINRLRMAMLRAGRAEKQMDGEGDEKKPGRSSYRKQLTEEELEVRRRINRVRVAMLRAQRTEEQIEAERRSQRARMAELRRRRSVDQIKNELELQRARMAALRKGRRSGEITPPKRRQSLSNQMMRECKVEQFAHYLDMSQSERSDGWHDTLDAQNNIVAEEIKLENHEAPKVPVMNNHGHWHVPQMPEATQGIKMESSNVPYHIGPPPEVCCQNPWCVHPIPGHVPPSGMVLENSVHESQKMCRPMDCNQIPVPYPHHPSDPNALTVTNVHPSIKPIVIIKGGNEEVGYH